MVPRKQPHRGTGSDGADRAPRGKTFRVQVTPSQITWARERAGLELADLVSRFPKLEAWEAGTIQPTFKQADAFARAVHVPIDDLFLSAPPKEPTPIDDFRTDFRTIGGKPVRRISPNLLDMIYITQRRQDWYRGFALMTDEPKARFVGSLTVDTKEETAAKVIAEELDFTIEARTAYRSPEETLRQFIDQADRAGVLVMVSGIVLNNTHRRLDPQEFRGFALVDDYAPLVFINGADTKAGQMFTLAHELAHLWLGVSALSDANLAGTGGRRQKEERWCNAVAAELLVPLDKVPTAHIPREALDKTVEQLSRDFKVSKLVILRRLLDAGVLDRAGFDAAWGSEFGRIMKLLEDKKQKKTGGGNFYHTALTQVGRRFAQALVGSTLEGQTLYRDAFRMLGVKKIKTFKNIGLEAGVIRPSEL